MTPAQAAGTAALTLGLLLPAQTALAGFTTQPTPPAPGYASSTLQPPGTVTASCTSGSGTTTATVSWTASPSTYTTGYTIRWTGGSTGSTTATSSPKAITGLVKNTSYTFTVTATYRNWTSTSRSSPVTAC